VPWQSGHARLVEDVVELEVETRHAELETPTLDIVSTTFTFSE